METILPRATGGAISRWNRRVTGRPSRGSIFPERVDNTAKDVGRQSPGVRGWIYFRERILPERYWAIGQMEGKRRRAAVAARPEPADTSRMYPGASRRLAFLTMFALLLALPLPSAAQSRYVRLEGRVQWIAGTVLSLAVNDGPAVGIDLHRAPQSDYSGVAYPGIQAP